MQINQLTLGELSFVEEKAKTSINQIGESPSAKTMMYLALVIKRREDPTFSEKQAADLTLDEVTEIITGTKPDAAELDPTSQLQPTG